jgi:N-acetylglutamate synthase-like GNAT family acetyltransferase
VEIREVHGYEELQRWVELRNAVFPDDPDSAQATALIRARQIDHVNLLAFDEGRAVGMAKLADDPGSTHAYVEVGVVPERRGRGIGSALFHDVSRRAAARGQTGLECEAVLSDSPTVDWLRRRGFREQGRLRQLVLASGDPLGDAPAPQEVALHPLGSRPDLVGGMFEVAQAAYGELAGHRPGQADTLTEWQVYELGGALDLDLSLVAERDGDVLGYSTLLAPEGTTDAFHRMTCVLPGMDAVATALVREQAVRAREAGRERVLSWALTPRIEGWLLALGFRVADESVTLRGPLL